MSDGYIEQATLLFRAAQDEIAPQAIRANIRALENAVNILLQISSEEGILKRVASLRQSIEKLKNVERQIILDTALIDGMIAQLNKE